MIMLEATKLKKRSFAKVFPVVAGTQNLRMFLAYKSLFLEFKNELTEKVV